MNTIIEIRPEHGGKDAEDFAQELADSITKALSQEKYKYQLTELTEFKKAFSITVKAPKKSLEWLQGYHAVQRIPKKSAARHTSAATVVVRQEVDNKKNDYYLDMKDVKIDRYRGHGAGGQRKNKVSTAIRVVHQPTGITITRETGRSQIENLESALDQLKDELSQLSTKAVKSDIYDSRHLTREKQQKNFTHNHQRGEVVFHKENKRWSMKTWQSGKIWNK